MSISSDFLFVLAYVTANVPYTQPRLRCAFVNVYFCVTNYK